jgi:hypothetical protein
MKFIPTAVLYGVLLTVIFIWQPWGRNGENLETFHLYYLLLALGIWLVSYRLFGGRFVRPKWKQAGKLIAYLVISFLLLIYFDHYALIFIIGHQLLGVLGHFMICKKHGINFWTSQPEEKYLEVMERWSGKPADR